MNDDYHFRAKDCLAGTQILFVAFGALILVPLLTGLDPNVALFTAGCGTLLFQVITRGQVPVFLGSSFAFIAPIIYGIKTWGLPGTLCGLMAAGLLYVLLSIMVRIKGNKIINKILPPVVTGPVIMTIGLILSPVAVSMFMGKSGDGLIRLVDSNKAILVATISLITTVIVFIWGRGFLKIIPILSGIAVGYLVSIPLGLIDLAPVYRAPWFAWPNFVLPEWNLEAIIYILPIAIAPAIEHVGDVVAISSITGKNFLIKPGIKTTLLGDGLATSFAAFFGGPPNTTYSEVTGALAIIKIYNPALMTWAAIVAIVLAFFSKLGALLHTIPVPVMGGILTLLFGSIMVVGLNTIKKSDTDLTEPSNFVIVALIMVFGIGGMTISAGPLALKGIGLAGILGVILNLIINFKKICKD